MHWLAILSFLVVFTTTSCGWHIRNTLFLPNDMKTMILNSNDPNGPLSNAIRNKLRINGIKLIEKNSLYYQNIPSLRILTFNLSQNAIAVSQSSNIVEYKIILYASIEIIMPNKNIYLINTKECRSFLNEPQIALAKDAEQEIIIDEMYDAAAENLLRKLSNLRLFKERILIPKLSGFFSSYLF